MDLFNPRMLIIQLRKMTFFFLVLCLVGLLNNTLKTEDNDRKFKVKSYSAEQPQLFLFEPSKKQNNVLIKKENKEYEIKSQDGTDSAWKQNFELTKDISLGYPPYERMEVIRNLISQNLTGNRPIQGMHWIERGPSNIAGRTRAILFDPHINTAANAYTKVWAGGVDGGLWWTDDVTASIPNWNHVNDLWDNLAISCISYNPANMDEYFVGTGEGWQANNNIPMYDAAIGGGIWHSIDGGLTWQLIQSTAPSSTTDFNYIQKIAVKPPYIYVATKNAGLQRADLSNLAVWQKVLGANLGAQKNSISDIEIASNGIIYVSIGIGERDGIYSSSTGNVASWTLLTGPTSGFTQSNTAFRNEIAVSNSSPDVLYSIVDIGLFAKLYKYSTITSIWTLMPNFQGGPLQFNGQAWYASAISISNTNPDELFVGGKNLHKSNDGGVTWIQISNDKQNHPQPYVHPDQHSIVFSPQINGITSTALFTNDGGIYFSSNSLTSNTPQFTNKNNGYNVTQFYSCAMDPTASSNYFLGGTQDNGTQLFNSSSIAATNDVLFGDGGNCFIDFDLPNLQIVTAQGPRSWYKSTNNWNTHSPLFSGSSAIHSDCYYNFIAAADYDSWNDLLFFSDAPTVGGDYVCGDDCYYGVKNVNTGTFISKKISVFGDNPTGTITHIRVSPYAPVNSSTIFIGTLNSRLFKVSNAHTATPTIAEIMIPNSGALGHAVSCIDIGEDENRLLLTFSNFGTTSVWETIDGGINWVNKEGTLPDMPVYWALYNPNDRMEVMLATEMGVWSSDDISASTVQWGLDVNSGMPNTRVYQLRYRSSDNLVLAATHGRGIWSTDSYNHPVANFTTTQSQPCPGLAVNFTDASTLSPTSWLWDFGDGTTSTAQNPSHIYALTGNYSVKLTVTNASGSDSYSQSINATLECCTGDLILKDNDVASTYALILSTATNILIEGKFTFDNDPLVNGMNLNGKNFIAMPGAEIVVAAGVNLTFASCNFYACSDMWSGIRTESGSKLDLRNCSIKDADKGTSIDYQGSFNFKDCEFENNIYGIFAYGDNNPLNKEGLFTIVGCSFGFASELKLKYAAQANFGTRPCAGIFMRLRNGIIGDNNYNPNTFNDLNTGILLKGSTIRIYNATFDAIHNEGFYPEEYMGSAIYAQSSLQYNLLDVNGAHFSGGSSVPLVTMNNCDYGVYTYDIRSIINSCAMEQVGIGVYGEANTNLKLHSVSNCSINASLYGVHLLSNPGALSISIKHNSIHTTDAAGICILVEDALPNATTALEILENLDLQCDGGLGGIAVTNFEDPLIKWNNVIETGKVQRDFSGILISGCNQAEVSCNSVQGSGIDPLNESSGIRLDQSTECVVHCNVVNETNYGFAFNGTCGGANMADNEMQNHDEGLHLNSVASMGLQIQNGNRWVGSYGSGFGAVNMNVSFFSLSEFRVHTLIGTQYYPSVDPPTIPNQTGWFNTYLGGSAYDCDNFDECNPDPDIRMLNNNLQLEQSIANGSFSTVDYLPESKNIAKQYLFSRLDNDSVLRIQNQNFQNFYSNQLNTGIGKLEDVADDVKGLVYYDSFFSNALNNVSVITKNLLDSLKQLDSLRLVGANDTLIDSAIVLLKTQLNTAQLASQQIISQKEAYLAGETSLTQGKNNLIVSNELPEQNAKTVNTVYLETIAIGNYEFTASKISALTPIAHQCPFAGGPAVYSSRVILKLAKQNIIYDDETVCWSQGIYRLAQTKSENNTTDIINPNIQFSIAPNPSNGAEINSFYSVVNTSNSAIVITNLEGVVLTKINLQEHSSSVKLHISHLVNGMYFVKLLENEKVIKNIKLTVIK